MSTTRDSAEKKAKVDSKKTVTGFDPYDFSVSSSSEEGLSPANARGASFNPHNVIILGDEREPLIKPKVKTPTSFDSNASCWSRDDKLLHILRHPGDDLRAIRWKKRLTDSVQFAVTVGWPLLFSALTLKDLIDFYVRPELRYGNTILDILLGTSTNTQTYTSHLGSELLHAKYDGLWWTGMVSLPFVLTGSTFLLKTLVKGEENNDAADIINNLPPIRPTFLKSINPWSNFRKLLHDAEFVCLYDNELDSEGQFELLNKVKTLLKSTQNSFSKLWLAHTLTSMICHLDSVMNLEKGGLRAVEWSSHRNEAVNAIKDSKVITALYLRSKLKDKHPAWFWVPSITAMSFVAYTNARYLETMIRRIYETSLHANLRESCEKENNVYVKMPESHQHECTTCGDWPFVFYGNVRSTQGCLSDLLVSVKDPAQIVRHLTQLSQRPGFNTALDIDLSKQDWIAWPEDQWVNFLNIISNGTKVLSNFDLSYSYPVTKISYEQKFQALGGFVTKIKIMKIKLSNLGINDGIIEQLFPSLMMSEVKSIDLSHNKIGTEGACFMSGHFSEKNPQHLSLKNNLISDDVAPCLLPQQSDSPLTSLDLTSNKCGEKFFEALSVSRSHLTEIYLNENDLRGVKPDVLVKAITQNHELKKLHLSGARLGQGQVAAIANCLNSSNVSYLDLSRNFLLDQNAIKVLLGVGNSTVEIINLSYNELTDQTLFALSASLNQTGLKHLSIDGNDFSVNGINALFASMAKTPIERISLAACNLDDQAADVIAAHWGSTSYSIRSLTLSNNKITDIGFLKLVTSLPKQLSEFFISKNYLGSRALAGLNEHLAHSGLEVIDLSGNSIPGNDLAAVCEQFPGSKLRVFNVSRNPLGDESVIACVEKLISPVPNIQFIQEVEPSRDFSRALVQSTATSQMDSLYFASTGVTDRAARAVCRVAPQAGIQMRNIYLDGNSINPSEVDITTCEIKPTVSLQGMFANKKRVVMQPVETDLVVDTLKAVGISVISAGATTLFVEGLIAKGIARERAELLGVALSATLTLFSGSSYPFITSMVIQVFCKKVLGCHHETALLMGNIGSSLVGSTQEFSYWDLPGIALSAAGSVAGSKLGFWVGRKLTSVFRWDQSLKNEERLLCAANHR